MVARRFSTIILLLQTQFRTLQATLQQKLPRLFLETLCQPLVGSIPFEFRAKVLVFVIGINFFVKYFELRVIQCLLR